jgi:hypothetical protein
MKCKGCDLLLWMEGPIDDDIPLCHSCYQIEDLRIQYTEGVK